MFYYVFSEEPKLRKLSQLRKVVKVQHFEDEVADFFVKNPGFSKGLPCPDRRSVFIQPRGIQVASGVFKWWFTRYLVPDRFVRRSRLVWW